MEPEPMERQLFAGAGAKIVGPAPGTGMQIHIKCNKNRQFFILKI
jgi:hypothetical protein